MFLLIILINGSNFIDGLNGLLLIYMTIVLFVLLDTSLLSNTNLKLLLEIDGTYILFLVITLVVIIILNLMNLLMLGDAGAYVLSFFVGYLLYYVIILTLIYLLIFLSLYCGTHVMKIYFLY